MRPSQTTHSRSVAAIRVRMSQISWRTTAAHQRTEHTDPGGDVRQDRARRCIIKNMNGMGFTASLISSMAWPIAVLGAIVIFRKPLIRLIGNIRQYEGFGQKITFGEELAGTENRINEVVRKKEVTGITDAPLGRPASEGPVSNELSVLAENHPSLTVLSAWDGLYKILMATVERDRGHGATLGSQKFWNRLADVIPKEWIEMIKSLYHLRNMVAHGQHKPMPGEAVAYVESCEDMSRMIESDSH
jgi:hypothetical protein